jgi:hypothetical protein
MKEFKANDKVIYTKDSIQIEGYVLIPYHDRQVAAVILASNNKTPVYIEYKELTKIE